MESAYTCLHTDSALILWKGCTPIVTLKYSSYSLYNICENVYQEHQWHAMFLLDVDTPLMPQSSTVTGVMVDCCEATHLASIGLLHGLLLLTQ